MSGEPWALGLFVGGRSRRMGGRPKGLLAAPDTGETLVARSLRIGRALGATVVLVGEASAYDTVAPDTLVLRDDPADCGPLGGLCALLAWAAMRAPTRHVVALACDMPFVGERDLLALRDDPRDVPCVAVRRDGRWEPFLARYDAASVHPVAARYAAEGGRVLQGLLDALGAVPAAVDDDAALDWDAPDDLTRCRTP